MQDAVHMPGKKGVESNCVKLDTYYPFRQLSLQDPELSPTMPSIRQLNRLLHWRFWVEIRGDPSNEANVLVALFLFLNDPTRGAIILMGKIGRRSIRVFEE